MNVIRCSRSSGSGVLLLVVGLSGTAFGLPVASPVDEPVVPAKPALAPDQAKRERAVADTLDWLAVGGWSDSASVAGRFRDAMSAGAGLGDRVALGLLTLLDHGDLEVVVRVIAVIGELAASQGAQWPEADMRERLVQRFLDAGTTEGRAARVRLAALEELVALPEGRDHWSAMTTAALNLVETGEMGAAARSVELLMLMPGAAVEAAFSASLADSQGDAKRRLLDAACRLPLSLDVGVISGLLDRSQTAGIRASAARLLGVLVGRQRPFSEEVRERVSRQLVETLQLDPAARVREAVCRALGDRLVIDGDANLALCLAVGDPVVAVRRAALETLGDVGEGVRALDTVKAVVVAEGPETEIGGVAKLAGERIRRRTSLAPRPDQYNPRLPAEQKYALAAAVSRVPREDGIDVMISMLDDPDPGARQQAFRTLLAVTPPGRRARAQGDGVPFGYRFDGSVESRRSAARRWREWFWEWRAKQGR